MNYYRESKVMYRLKPFLFTHATLTEMFHFICECASRIRHYPHSVYLSDHNTDQRTQLTYNLPTQRKEFLDYLNHNFHTIWTIHVHCECSIQDGRKIPYSIVFRKGKNADDINATIDILFRDVHLSGQFLDFYLERLRDQVAQGYQPDATDDFVNSSFEIYDLAKEWMNVLQAEECWGGDTTEHYAPYFYSDNYYQYADFRFRKNGPQYVDISLEDRHAYTWQEADEKVRQELLQFGYDEDKTRRHYEPMRYGRIIDTTWDEYYQMFIQGIKPPMRYADESELYDHPDALFGDIKARAEAHKQLQEKLKSGDLNFDEGFMTLD
jgi:hypothetical protein